MFVGFLSSFKLTSQVECSHNISFDVLDETEQGFLHNYGGATFDRGVYRIHRSEDITKWTNIVEDAFPIFKNKILCFGFDWLGRHFAINTNPRESERPLVLCIEPGTGEALHIPATFFDFHNKELVSYRNDALASSFFDQWIAAKGDIPEHSQCIGYKVPLFLGGKDVLENLEISDMDVYWSLCGQMINAKVES